MLAALLAIASPLSAAPPVTEPTVESNAVVAVEPGRVSAALRDELAMVLVGAALIALAAAVRRAA